MIASPPRVSPSAIAPLGGPAGHIVFESGLLGFQHFHEYRLTEGPGDALYWLTAIDERGPSFILADPFAYFEGFGLDVPPEQARLIDAVEPGEVVVLSIAVPGSQDGEWTANLQGPVVINARNLRATQLVLGDRSPDLRRPFRPVLANAQRSRQVGGQ